MAVHDHEFSPDTVIFGHTHLPFKLLSEESGLNLYDKALSAYNTGGWVVDLFEAGHLADSRPLVAAITETGDVKDIQIPWPSKQDFEDITRRIKDGTEIRKGIKKLIKDALMGKRE